MQLDFPSLGKQVYDNAEVVIKELLNAEQTDCSVIHRFGPGLYIREVHMPAGTFAIGHEQKFPHLNVFIKGAVRMLMPDGTTKDVSAPMTFVGQPGRKCGLILEDVIWQNVYATEETDIDKLESMFLKKPDFWDVHMKTLAIDHRADYVALLGELGVTEEQVQIEVSNMEDRIPMPAGWEKVVVRDSLVHGKGLFVTYPVVAGEIIAPARLGGMRTPAGVCTNHAILPNAEMRAADNGDIYLVAMRDIAGCKGGGMGEEVMIDYRQALAVSGRM